MEIMIVESNTDSKSVHEFVKYENKYGNLFWPILMALLLKDNISIEDQDAVRLIREYGSDKNNPKVMELIHNYAKREVLWQPQYAATKGFSYDYIEEIFPGQKTYSVIGGKEIFYANPEVDEIFSKYRGLISTLIRSQTMLRRFMKGEAGQNELLLFMCAVVGLNCEYLNMDINDILQAIACYFDCVDLDYLEPVPSNYETTNLEALERIYKDKCMDMEERLRKLEINPCFDNEFLDFIKDTSFVGGFDFFYKHGEKVTNLLLEKFRDAVKYKYGLEKQDQPCIINLKGIADKKFLSLKHIGICVDSYKPFYRPFARGNLRFDSDKNTMRVTI